MVQVPGVVVPIWRLMVTLCCGKTLKGPAVVDSMQFVGMNNPMLSIIHDSNLQFEQLVFGTDDVPKTSFRNTALNRLQCCTLMVHLNFGRTEVHGNGNSRSIC